MESFKNKESTYYLQEGLLFSIFQEEVFEELPLYNFLVVTIDCQDPLLYQKEELANVSRSITKSILGFLEIDNFRKENRLLKKTVRILINEKTEKLYEKATISILKKLFSFKKKILVKEVFLSQSLLSEVGPQTKKNCINLAYNVEDKKIVFLEKTRGNILKKDLYKKIQELNSLDEEK